jgi:23S rRNA (cytosine1962-C5)-methyltransferase
MRIAQDWNDYELIDIADGEKCERFGPYILVRPEPAAIMRSAGHGEHGQIAARYHRSEAGGGNWETFIDVADKWTVRYPLSADFTMRFSLSLFSFKHTGLFPEQAVNWRFIYDTISLAKRNIAIQPSFCAVGMEAVQAVRSDSEVAESKLHGSCDSVQDDIKGATEQLQRRAPARAVKVLNLFAYTGGASIAAAAAGAHVTHVDASKGMIALAKENATQSGLPETAFRYIADDCQKFVAREIKRGNRYDAIIMDPPTYGRGPNGEMWRLEDHLCDLFTSCLSLLSDMPLFVLLSAYTPGITPGLAKLIMQRIFVAEHGGTVEADEIGLPVGKDSDMCFPCGMSAIWKAVEK